MPRAESLLAAARRPHSERRPKNRVHARADRSVARIGGIALPRGQLQGLRLAKAQRRIDLVDRNREVDLATLGAARFVPDEASFRTRRPFAPYDDDAAGSIEMLRDRFTPCFPAAYARIPPDRQALSLKPFDEGLDPSSSSAL